MTQLFPISLKMSGRRALVIGGGRVARLRIEQLLSAGAAVKVIAPDAERAIEDFSLQRRIELLRREVVPSDIESGYAVVIAATDDAEAQQMIAAEAARRGLLYNIADNPDNGAFFMPAVAQRGSLKIAISTDGNSPVLAGWLRDEIDRALPREIEALPIELGELRRALKIRIPGDMEKRKQIIRKVIEAMTEADGEAGDE